MPLKVSQAHSHAHTTDQAQWQKEGLRESRDSDMAVSLPVEDIERAVLAGVRAALQGVGQPVPLFRINWCLN